MVTTASQVVYQWKVSDILQADYKTADQYTIRPKMRIELESLQDELNSNVIGDEGTNKDEIVDHPIRKSLRREERLVQGKAVVKEMVDLVKNMDKLSDFFKNPVKKVSTLNMLRSQSTRQRRSSPPVKQRGEKSTRKDFKITNRSINI